MKKENELLKVKKEVNTLFMVVSGLVCAIIGNFFHPLGAIIGFLVGGWLGHKKNKYPFQINLLSRFFPIYKNMAEILQIR